MISCEKQNNQTYNKENDAIQNEQSSSSCTAQFIEESEPNK